MYNIFIDIWLLHAINNMMDNTIILSTCVKCQSMSRCWRLLCLCTFHFDDTIFLFCCVYSDTKRLPKTCDDRRCSRELATHNLSIVYCCYYYCLNEVEKEAHERTRETVRNENKMYSLFIRTQLRIDDTIKDLTSILKCSVWFQKALTFQFSI